MNEVQKDFNFGSLEHGAPSGTVDAPSSRVTYEAGSR